MVETSQRHNRTLHFPSWPRWRLVAWVRRFLLTGLVFPLLRIGYSVRIEGRENVREVAGPSLIISNHNMHLDIAMLMRSLPFGFRKRVSVAAASRDIFGNPIRGFWAGFLGNAFPFYNRGAGIRDSLEFVAELLRDGWHVLIFPEGQLTVGGPTRPFKTGIGRLAVETGVQVLPMRIDITRKGFYEGKWLPTPRAKVVVHIGKPVHIAPGTSYQEATGQLERAVREA